MLELDKIYCVDVLQGLKQLDAESIDCVITSPPYWNLRDYKTEPIIWDGKDGCEHEWGEQIIRKSYGNVGTHPTVGNQIIDTMAGTEIKGNFCVKCGAWLGNLGLEPTFDLYVKHLCDVFDEVKRVLKKTGTVWVNIGDTYSGGGAGQKDTGKAVYEEGDFRRQPTKTYLSDTCLCQIPSRFSIEMCNRDWILRNEIIWCLDKNSKILVKDNNKYKHISISEAQTGMFVPTQNQKGEIIWVKIKNIFNNGIRNTLKITTKTGREIICTPEHKFVVKKNTTIAEKFRKIKIEEAKNLKGKEYLYVNEQLDLTLPDGNEDDYKKGFVVGFFIAEGTYIKNKVGVYKNNKFSKSAIRRWGRNEPGDKKNGCQFSCGISDIERGHIAYLQNYNIKIYQYGNSISVTSRDKQLLRLITDFVHGEHSDGKHLNNLALNQSRQFLTGIVDGFLAGDGYYDFKNNRYIVGICINKNLVDDINLLSRILGYQFRVSYRKNGYKGVAKMSIRKTPMQRRIFGCITDKIDRIEPAGDKEVYDMEIEPIHTTHGSIKETKQIIKAKWNNLYFLANGIWTHNSKPNAMPSSVKSRFTVDFEKIYFFVKDKKYWFETQYEPHKVESIRRACRARTSSKLDAKQYAHSRKNEYVGYTDMMGKLKRGELSHALSPEGRNKRCVWTADSKYNTLDIEKEHRQGMHKERGDGVVEKRDLPPQKEFVDKLRENFTIDDLVKKTKIPKTKIEHWFRYDESGFAYPTKDDWEKVETELFPELLNVWYETDAIESHPNGRIKRAVWTVTTRAFKDSHFASFPETLIEPMVLAGCPEFICTKCGKPREKLYEKVGVKPINQVGGIKKAGGDNRTYSGNTTTPIWGEIGYSDCCCKAEFDGGVVLDPFCGSGTACLVANKLNRHYIGFDLNPEYVKMAINSIISDRDIHVMNTLKLIDKGKQRTLE